jgi:hypothetical protein
VICSREEQLGNRRNMILAWVLCSAAISWRTVVSLASSSAVLASWWCIAKPPGGCDVISAPPPDFFSF